MEKFNNLKYITTVLEWLIGHNWAEEVRSLWEVEMIILTGNNLIKSFVMPYVLCNFLYQDYGSCTL